MKFHVRDDGAMVPAPATTHTNTPRPGEAPGSRSRTLATDAGYKNQTPIIMAAIAATRTFDTGATRDTDAGKLDYEGFLSPLVIKAFAEYMHGKRTMPDGSMRDSDNWQKGIPEEVYMKSMFRHFFSVWETHRAWSDEDIEQELLALLFNVQGYLHETIKKRRIRESD